jgi:hypothetical protein
MPTHNGVLPFPSIIINFTFRQKPLVIFAGAFPFETVATLPFPESRQKLIR